MKNTTTLEKIHKLVENNLSIVRFRDESYILDSVAPDEPIVVFDTKDLPKLHDSWLNWLEVNDFYADNQEQSFNEYVESFLKTLNIPYQYIVPNIFAIYE